MNANQLHILQHSLGCDQYGQSKHRGADEGDGCFGYYRNRYVSDATPELTELVSVGYLHNHGPQVIAGGMCCYSVTLDGIKAMLKDSPNPPKLTRSQRRWQEFRRVSEVFDSFGQWLAYRKARDGRYP